MTDAIHDDALVHEFIFHSTDNGVLVVNGDNLVSRMNPAAAAMLSINPEDVLGKAPRLNFHRNQALMRLFKDEKETRLDVPLPRKRIALGVAKTLASGERIVLLQDITEKRNIEDRREMLSKAIAHDLRNPISAIRGFADLVSRFGEVNEQQERYLQRIRQTTSKLHDVVKSLVDLAWIEAGMPLAHVPLRLDETIHKAVNNLQPEAKKLKIGIAVAVQRPLPVVMGDPDRLEMVIHNLLLNAIIYSEPESNVVIHAWGDETQIFCSVADKGIGVMESEQELIFDRMYRSRDDRVMAIPGGGLGLTVVRTIVRRHGGDIWAHSQLNEGSTFTFMLPAVEL